MASTLVWRTATPFSFAEKIFDSGEGKLKVFFVALFASCVLLADSAFNDLESGESGQERISRLVKEYNAGEHKSFLEKADSLYRKKRDKWQYDKLLDTRKQFSQLVLNKTSQKSEPFEQAKRMLKKKRDIELTEVITNHPNFSIVKPIKNVVFFLLTPDEKEALQLLDHLSQFFEGEGGGELQKRLVNLDVEYGLKQSELFANTTLSWTEVLDKWFILEWDKLQRMIELSDKHGACDTKTQLSLASAALMKQIAYSCDEHLLELVKGMQPKNVAEQKTKQILATFAKEQHQLTATFFPKDGDDEAPKAR